MYFFFKKADGNILYKESQNNHTVYVDDLLLKKCFAFSAIISLPFYIDFFTKR